MPGGDLALLWLFCWTLQLSALHSPGLIRAAAPARPRPACTAGEVVALYQYREAERLEGPAVVGESVLLQEHEEALKTYPCTYRTLTGCSCWMVRLQAAGAGLLWVCRV